MHAPPSSYDVKLGPPRVDAEPVRASAWRRAAKRAAAEPLVHFIVLSALLWGAHAEVQTHARTSRVTITPALTARLAQHYRQQYGASPSGAQLEALIEAAITEEIEYRQALELGLDRGDEIVRRRLIQKYEFLQQDLTTPQDPTPAQAQDFYARNLERYVQPEHLTFTQVYFSPDRRGDVGARDSAAAAAAALRQRGVTRAPDDGDRYPGPADFVRLTPEEIGRVFGREGLAQEILTLPVGQWSAPLKSGYGWHTVYVQDREPARQAGFAEVHEQVAQDFRDAERRRRNAESAAATRSLYQVVRE